MGLIGLILFLIIITVSLFLGIWIFRADPKAKINRWFMAIAISIIFWNIFAYLGYISKDITQSLMYFRLNFAAVSIYFICSYFFALFFPVKTRNHSHVVDVIISLIGGAFAYISLATDLIVKSVAIPVPNQLEVKAGILGDPFYLFTILLTFYILYILITKNKQLSKTDQDRTRYFLIGIILYALANVIFNIVVPFSFPQNYKYTQLGDFSAIFFLGFTAYAILKHHLFDVRVIIRKVFLYTSLLSIVFGTYTLSAFLLTSFLPLNQTVSSFLAAAMIAFGFEPLRTRLQAITERYLFVADYDADKELKHLTEALSGVVDLDEALRQVIQHLTRAMKLSRAAAVVLVRDGKGVVTVRRIQEVAFPGARRLMSEEYLSIVTLFLHEPRIQLVELMQQEVDEQEINDKTLKRQVVKGSTGNLVEQEAMRALKKQALAHLKKVKVAVVVPIMVKEKLIGLIYLGEKLSNANFFEDDLNFITIVSSQTGSAIEKARFYEEDQLKSEFVSIASHELLTPTTAIEGYLSMILDENMAKVDPKAREYLEKVYMSAKRLSTLVKDLLSVSRIEAGRMKIEPKVFDIGELVQQQVDQLIFKAKDAGLTLSYALPKKPAQVFADPDRTAQAVVNLIGNAIKYTPKGSVTVEVLERAHQVEVAVTDTGMGIKPEDREHLFEKFQRVNTSETTGIIGSGLGLYITKSIIELMNGAVTVKSTYGKGSTFAFTLPKRSIKP